MNEQPAVIDADSEGGLSVSLLDDGLLWLINRSVFHPRGFALAVDTAGGGLTLYGDGSEVWKFDLGAGVEDAKLAAVNACFELAAGKAPQEDPWILTDRLPATRPGESLHVRGEQAVDQETP